MTKRIFLIVFVATLFTSCSITRSRILQKDQPVNSLKFLGSYELPYNEQFNGTTIGGLSGIDYDPENRIYHLICDDRSNINPARFYSAKINFTQSGISNVQFVNSTALLQRDGAYYPDSKKIRLMHPIRKQCGIILQLNNLFGQVKEKGS
ncbi:MAG: esterase-like activity of phytase family protein [Chitinophagaceae bacterium]